MLGTCGRLGGVLGVVVAAMLAGCQTTQRQAKQYVLPPGSGVAQVKGSQEPLSPQLEAVAYFTGPMPTGVTVSAEGRVFVSFPRWGDPVAFTVGELKGGQLTAYPDAQINQLNMLNAKETLVSVQSVVVDPANRLWLLDAGNTNMGLNLPEGPKLVGVDLGTNKVFKIIHFPSSVALPTTYLNDMQFDLRRGPDGTAYITDSAQGGPNGIIVVDLATGKSWRRLSDQMSVKADPNFVPTVEGEGLMLRPALGEPQMWKVGADGLALSADGKRLYYRPLVSRHLYSVSAEALADEKLPDEVVAQSVQDLGDIGFASDGMESDAAGRLYLTDYEHHAIRWGNPNVAPMKYEVLVSDPRLIWPDTLALAGNGYLYVTVNQLNRQGQFQAGKDLRQPPYALFRMRVEAKPLRLMKEGGVVGE